MPLFRMQVHYTRGLLDKWSNVWHVNAATLLEASVEFNLNVVPPLLTILSPSCTLARTLCSSLTTDEFIINTVGAAGTSGFDDSLLPLFNCAKVIIDTPGFGRPDLKYIKGYLTEANTDNGLIASGAMADIDNAITSAIVDLVDAGVHLASNEGDNYTVVAVQQAVQMRQMHRKRKKKVVTP